MFKLTFKQQVLTGFAVSLAFVFISALASYLSVQSLTDSSNWITHTYKVINVAEKAEIELINAETGLRGFVITQSQSYKAPYNKSINQILARIADLKVLVSDNPSQRKKVDSLEIYASQKVEDMKNIMALANTSGFEAARQDILTNKGQTYKVNFLRVSENIITRELELLKERQATNTKRSDQTVIVVLLSALIIFALILFLLRYIRRTFDQQKETEREILLTNTELAQVSALNEHNNWLLTGAAEINEAMQGEQEIEALSANIITKIGNYIDAAIGALFLVDNKKNILYLTGAYAYQSKAKHQIKFGEGLVGQTALEKKSKLISNVPNDYIKVNSALGETTPNHLFLVPIIFENKTIAVAELGFLRVPQEKKLQLISNIAENIGIALNSALAHLQLKELFEETQQQAEELASQQEELRTTNEELIYKTEALQASEEELRVQQEELQQTNTELEEKAQQLEERNLSINEAKEAISIKAAELELSSKYKSEFLANMSHELRTPLNSILILARILKENRPNNLSDEQIKYAGVIHNAGNDLLTLINDILDLSKIESGSVDLHLENIRPSEIRNNIESLFIELANHKKIEFKINLAHDLPTDFVSDQGRLEQIIKNLLSNAFKFTPEKGKIGVEIGLAKSSVIKNNASLKTSGDTVLSFAISDTGIGISADKQQVIFEAFQQEDGSTSRKYGGTGLGLSISKELANILGGEIQIKSEQGVGSTFTLFVPLNLTVATAEDKDIELPEVPNDITPEIKSSANSIELLPVSSEGNTLLIIEDDVDFAEILKIYATDKGFNPILAHSGDVGLQMATELLPDAIVLDVMLPIMDGWTILKKLKADPTTQHIPVHMMSAGNEKETKAVQEGAIGFLKKPIEKDKLDHAFELLINQHQYTFKNVLIVEDQILQSNALTEQLIERGAKVSQAYTGKEALEILKEQHFDCIILDLKLPDISGFDLLDQIKAKEELKHIPVIINTAMELDRDKMAHIMQYTEAMVLKTNKSNDRLLDEVSLFINKLQKQPSTPTIAAARQTPTKKKHANTLEKALKDKTILITDDDMRNIFALSSALQAYDIKIIIANNGIEALAKIEENPQIDLVLMDIMMPEMDGYEAMRRIRNQKQLVNLPIIALTAKAMKNDREKCIEAGANDYISKPVDVDQLLSMLRVWLS
ncbi:response regulator [Pedobacter sp. Hv1]|uniref:response regulator n=1 Tax=Pedobacter sp. Hv1 TaxID=1740090 RepID=UPI0006D89809|nr:response regulator [Pedobacter sp. Hv1]KQC02645.1 histidine kinase [Pedobacter sp. Hv1]